MELKARFCTLQQKHTLKPVSHQETLGRRIDLPLDSLLQSGRATSCTALHTHS